MVSEVDVAAGGVAQAAGTMIAIHGRIKARSVVLRRELRTEVASLLATFRAREEDMRVMGEVLVERGDHV